MIYDAIVVGAGPAGSTAAREIARRGGSVLLLERARFPRDKPCGGGVTPRAAKLLPFDLAPVLERSVDSVYFSLKQRAGFVRRSSAPLTLLTQRRRLDAFLVQQAEAAGATFHDGDGVSGLELTDHGVTVLSRCARQKGRVVIGADGANGVVARLCGLGGPRDVAVALEGNIPCPDGLPRRWQRAIGMDLGGIPGGYGWLFPKGDHLNVGVGGWQYLAGSLRARLNALCAFYDLPAERLQNLRGYQLPVRRPGSPLARGRVALAGDAAGLLDPLSGEGIYAAISSGRTVARHAAALLAGRAASLAGYAAAIERELAPDLVASRRFQDLFYLVPELYVGLLRRSDRIWELLASLIRGEQSYVGFKRRLGPLGWAVDVGSLAVRTTPFGRIAGLPPRS
ncbi:MAG TPA: geranylgeranyl reductase family protein [Dehalococcoidia bacterium]|nr:geranylgeranyl reductase family protein [Dehalococcoidia bacterium]